MLAGERAPELIELARVRVTHTETRPGVPLLDARAARAPLISASSVMPRLNAGLMRGIHRAAEPWIARMKRAMTTERVAGDVLSRSSSPYARFRGARCGAGRPGGRPDRRRASARVRKSPHAPPGRAPRAPSCS